VNVRVKIPECESMGYECEIAGIPLCGGGGGSRNVSAGDACM
jgi:hypothetical protein